jgi:hypothetical protein
MLKFLRKTALWIIAVPLICYILGAACNQVVLVSNQDRFPVQVNDYSLTSLHDELEQAASDTNPAHKEAAQEAQFRLMALDEEGFLDDVHVVMGSKTHLNWLGDWCDLKDAHYSPGDGLLILGEYGMQYAFVLWMFVAILKLSRTEDTQD